MGRWFKSADYLASQIVKGLYDRGVDLFVEGGRLNYKSRIEGTVTNDDLVDLDENKAEIIALRKATAKPGINPNRQNSRYQT